MIANCLYCNFEIEIYKTGHKRMRKFCNTSCSTSYNNKMFPKKISKLTDDLRKKDVSRQEIGAHARAVYKKSGKQKMCKICNYSFHVDIAHIKEVKSFPEDTKLSVINNIDNLVALCKNHHWELDHGKLQL